MDGAEPQLAPRKLGLSKKSPQPPTDMASSEDEKSQEDAVTVAASKRQDIVLGHTKSALKAQAKELKLLMSAGDNSTAFLMQKKNVEQVVATRLKSLDGGKGCIKLLKKKEERIEAKGVQVDDLPTSTDELLKSCKAMCKDLKQKKKDLPGLKKVSLAPLQKDLQSSAEKYQASLQPITFSCRDSSCCISFDCCYKFDKCHQCQDNFVSSPVLCVFDLALTLNRIQIASNVPPLGIPIKPHESQQVYLEQM